MRSFVSILLVACACSAPAASTERTNPSNRVAPAPGEVTNLRVTILIAYDEYCAEPHPITVSIDGIARGFVKPPCAVRPPPGPNGRVIVTESGLRGHELPAIPVEPGRHRVTVYDALTKVTTTRELTFPTYSRRSPRLPPEVKTPLAEALPVYVSEEWIRIDDLVYGFFTM